MNQPIAVFIYGLALLALFGWYFFSDNERIKRMVGTALTVLIIGLCVQAVYPLNIKLGLDLQGGTSFLIRLMPSEDENGVVREVYPDTLERAVETIRKRVDKMGTAEPIIAPQGKDRILVQIPGLETETVRTAREQLQKVAKLEFRLVHPNHEAVLNGTQPWDPKYTKMQEKITREGKEIAYDLLVTKKADVPGDTVTQAFANYGMKGWEVNLRFDDKGTKLFSKLTSENPGRLFAIILDGVIVSAPRINEPITGGSCQITGRFSEKEARDLASVLENPLQNPVKIEEERSVSPTLGKDAITAGMNSGLYGIILTVVGVLLYYRFAGLVATIALAVNTVMLLGMMAMFNTVLTLPGIAGIILTLGMAIDANVLIYERLREELALGKSLKASLSAAYDKAFSAIFDSNLTTLITAGILFWQATGPVKGFAVTLTVGIVASMFTALVVTRNLFEWAIGLGWIKGISMTNFIKATNVDFMGARKVALTGSLIVIVASLGYFGLRGGKNFGVDFKGGDRLTLEAQGTAPSLADVRSAVEGLKLGDVQVQLESANEKEFLTVRSPEGTALKITPALVEKFPDAKYKEQGLERVGSVVGTQLAMNSLIALGLGMLGILIYVAIRFEFSFAVGAIVALLHDVIITLGVFSVMGRELSLVIVGAILTIAGYSVNDTIVVFDRIRESIKSGTGGSIKELMNRAINETLSRTILTGGVTIITTIILYIFGGPVLNDFALTMLVGVLVGTYSSIYVAAPIVLMWTKKSGKDLRVEIRESQFEPETAA